MRLLQHGLWFIGGVLFTVGVLVLLAMFMSAAGTDLEDEDY